MTDGIKNIILLSIRNRIIIIIGLTDDIKKPILELFLNINAIVLAVIINDRGMKLSNAHEDIECRYCCLSI
jgi:hypothetical protein